LVNSLSEINRFRRKFIWFMILIFLFALATMVGDWTMNFMDANASTGTAQDFLVIWDPWLGWDSWHLWYQIVYIVIIMIIFPLAFAFALAETYIWKHIAVIGIGFIFILSASLDLGWSIAAGDLLYWWNIGSTSVPYWVNVLTGSPFWISGYFIFFSMIIRFIVGIFIFYIGLRLQVPDLTPKIGECVKQGDLLFCKRRNTDA